MSQNSFTSRIGFILAAAGSAIGLGAIWKFPYVVGTNGGGAFLLMFIIFTFLLGLPLLIGEFLIGRTTQNTALLAFKKLGHERWTIIGYIGVIGCFILLSFYSVIGGWILIYFGLGLSGYFNELSSTQYSSTFENIVSSPGLVIFGQALFLLIVLLIILKGVESGIERVGKILMPLLFITFIVLVIRSITLEGASKGVMFFLNPDFSNISSDSVLFALGQSFFSLSLGVSTMLTYASYTKDSGSLNRSANLIVFLNIVVSLLAGLAIFPAVFASGLDPAEGPALLFIVLPTVFDQVPFGGGFMVLFFLLFTFASITSAIAMFEVVVASVTDYLNDIKVLKAEKHRIALIASLLVLLLGVPSALSFGTLENFNLLKEKTFFDSMDYIVSYVIMPIGALLTSIYVGYRIEQNIIKEQVQTSYLATKFYPLWRFLLRLVIPIVITIVLISSWFTL